MSEPAPSTEDRLAARDALIYLLRMVEDNLRTEAEFQDSRPDRGTADFLRRAATMVEQAITQARTL